MSGALNRLAGDASECLLFGQIRTSGFSQLILEPGQETALEIAGPACPVLDAISSATE
jgi:hypothetical protein